MVTVTDPGRNLPADPKFAMMDGKHMRTIGASTETIGVHTDIEAPTDTPFVTVYPLDTNDDPGTTADDARSLIIINDDEEHLMHVDLGIAKAPEGEVSRSGTFRTDSDETDDTNEGNHRGRFDGAMGTYNCATADGAGCTATVNDKGVTTALGGAWSLRRTEALWWPWLIRITCTTASG